MIFYKQSFKRVIALISVVLLYISSHVIGAEYSIIELLHKIPSPLPDDKTLKIEASETRFSKKDGKDNYFSNNIVFYINKSEGKFYLINSEHQSEYYCDGNYVLNISRYPVKENSANPLRVRVLIKNAPSDAREEISTYSTGLAYTSKELLSTNFSDSLGAMMILPLPQGTSRNIKIISDNKNIEIKMAISSKIEASSMNIEDNDYVLLDKSNDFAVKYCQLNQVISKDKKIIRWDKSVININSTIGFNDNKLQYPAEASYVHFINGIENDKLEFHLKSLNLVDNFPDPPEIPSNSQVTDERIGVKFKTGDAPSKIAFKIKEYLRQGTNEITGTNQATLLPK